MRTTVTLDEDLIANIREGMNSSGASFKETINAHLRQGLEQAAEEDLARSFVVEAKPMGLRPGVDLDDIGGLLDLLDMPMSP